MDDAEERLHDNLDGLDWLVPQLDGQPARPAAQAAHARAAAAGRPKAATRRPAASSRRPGAGRRRCFDDAREQGDAGAGPRSSPRRKFACLSCHRVGDQGGTVGPTCRPSGVCLKPEEIVESILWPRRQVKEGYAAVTVATGDGKIRQGYKQSRDRPTSWCSATRPRASDFRSPRPTSKTSDRTAR